MDCSEKLTVAVVSAVTLTVASYIFIYLYMVYQGFKSPSANTPIQMPAWMDYIKAPAFLSQIKSPVAAGMSSTAQEGTTPEGEYATIVWNGNKKKCWDIDRQGTKNGSRLQIFDCNGKANQQFMYSSDTGELRAKQSNKCITVPGNKQGNGNQLTISDCKSLPEQKWDRLGSTFQLLDTDKCIDLVAGNTKNGSKVAIYDCGDNAPHQSWYH